MKNFAFFVIFFSLTFICYSQSEKKLDSLYNLLNESKSDTTRMKIILNIGKSFERTNSDSAVYWYEKIFDIVNTSNSEHIKFYEHALIRAGWCYRDLSNFDRAIQCGEKLSELFLKDTVSTSKEVVIIGLNLLGNTYADIGNNMKALEHFEKALKYAEASNDYLSISTCFNGIAIVYFRTGNFPMAVDYFEKVLKTRRTLNDSLGISIALLNIGTVYSRMDKFPQAISRLEEALILKEKLGDLQGLFLTLNNLGLSYKSQGNYYEAIPFYLRALEIAEKIKNKKGIATCLLNLGGVYYLLNDYEKAISYYERAKIICEDIGDISGISAYNVFLAKINIKRAKFAEALELYEKSIDIYLKIDDKYSVSNLYSYIGELYLLQKDYSNAELFLKKSIKIKEDASIYTGIYKDYYLIAMVQYLQKSYAEALGYYISSNNITRDYIKNNFSIQTEREKEIYLKQVEDFFMSYYEFALVTQYDSAILECYNNELLFKGLLLQSTRNIFDFANNASDTSITNTFGRLKRINDLISELYSTPKSKRTIDLDSLIYLANKEESELVKLSSKYADSKKTFNLNCKDIEIKLNSTEIVIDFVKIRCKNSEVLINKIPEITETKSVFNGNIDLTKDSIIYAAFILKKGYLYPRFVYLFNENQLSSLLKKHYNTDREATTKLYSKDMVELYELIFYPFDTLLNDVKTIYYSPSGLLHKIAFAAIPTPDGKYLSDKYNLVQLGSTREIIKLKEKNDFITQSDNALIYGGVNYNKMDTLPDTLQTNALLSEVRSVAVPADSTQKNYPMNYLKETLAEAEFIDKLFESNKISSLFYSGSQATETSFKYTSGKSPQVIHIATHGYFYPDIKKKKDALELLGQDKQFYRFSENPLLRSGLMFAGANKVWTGGEAEAGRDDGILTAYEVSNMNLSNAKLVVLSACQTGLGDIKDNEGVYGLQRAFKMAGVKYIIASLWQVPGKETNEFMQLFYTNCFKKQSIREAFNNAQATMRKKYTPYYWGAFVLME